MLEQLPGVVISTREIYDSVIRLTGRVDALLEQMRHVENKYEDQSKDIADHEQRLRLLEAKRWPLQAVTVMIAIAALAVAFFKK